MKVLVLQASDDKRMDIHIISESKFFDFIKGLYNNVIVDFKPFYFDEDGNELDVDVAVTIYDYYVE